MNELGSRLRNGILQGIQVFLCYAVVEYVFLAVSLVTRPHRVMLIQQWRGTVVLLVSYLLLGILAGAVIGLLSRGEDPNGLRTRKRLVLTIIGAFMLNGATASLSVPNRMALVCATALIAVTVFFELGSVAGNRGLANGPMLVSGILVATSWLTSSTGITALGMPFRVLATMGAAAVLLGIAVLLHRLWGWSENRCSWITLIGHGCKAATLMALTFSPILISSWAEGKEPLWTERSPASAMPNVLLITLDTVNAEHMGIYGYSRANTPNLQALLKQSTFYTNFVAVAPLTLTSHASIFTGLYPQSHGAYREFRRFETGRPLDGRIPTMAQVLTSHGYHTMAIVANRYYLNTEFATLRGFQFVDWLAPTVLVAPDRDYLLRSRLRDVLRVDRIVQDLDNVTTPAVEVNRRALDMLDKASRQSSPFFLFLNYCDAHVPYLPPPPYSSLYPGRNLGFSLKNYTQLMDSVNNHNQPLPSVARSHLISQYDGAIAYLDARVGEIIQHLKNNGDFDRTMIIVTSDHGEAFGERNILFHDAAVYQDEVHIPLIVKYPGQRSAARVEAVATHVDLMPTVMNVLGIDPPANLQGVDLRDVAGARRVVVSEMHASTNYDGPRFQQIEYAVYSWPFKMIYSTNGMRELYDLSADPFERQNLFRLEAPITSDLRTKLVNWSFNTTPRYLDPRLANREVEERLKSLGYAHQGVD